MNIKACSGSSIVLVICTLAALSLLLLHTHRRSSLVLLTVIEREQQVKHSYATHALMLYAIQLAKKNWSHIVASIEKEPYAIDDFLWNIDESKEGNATCIFKKAEDNTICIEATLARELVAHALQVIIELNDIDDEKCKQVIIRQWKTV
ncbi:MAG: hypothetical protein WD055_00270 [Candidatus Dependentiae bacterium]